MHTCYQSASQQYFRAFWADLRVGAGGGSVGIAELLAGLPIGRQYD
jgi:hypothetical protein